VVATAQRGAGTYKSRTQKQIKTTKKYMKTIKTITDKYKMGEIKNIRQTTNK